MKKIFVSMKVFLSIAILLSLFMNLMVSAVTDPFFTAGAFNSGIKMVAPAGTTLTIVDGVYRMTSGANRPSFEVKNLSAENVKVKQYPIAAIKIKLYNTNSVFGGFDFATDTSLYIKNTLGANIGSYPMKTSAEYEKITDWQLVYADMSLFYDKYSTVGGVNHYWIDDNSKYSFNIIHPLLTLISGENVTFDLDWVGYFKTVEDARIYAGFSTPQLSKPNMLSWNGKTASWNAVDSAENYSLQLYKDNTPQGTSVTTTAASYDFSSQITSKGNYSFTVIAAADGYTDSEISDFSQEYGYPTVADAFSYEGFSIRTDAPHGLRVKYQISEEMLSASIVDSGFRVVEYGSILTQRESYDTSTGVAQAPLLLGDNFSEKDNTGKVMIWKDGQYYGNIYQNTSEGDIYTAVLVNINDMNLAKNYAFRAYCIMEDSSGEKTVIYSETNENSIYEIAKMALSDPDNDLSTEEISFIQTNIIDIVES